MNPQNEYLRVPARIHVWLWCTPGQLGVVLWASTRLLAFSESVHVIPGKVHLEGGGEKRGRESMKLHSDCEILTPADATRLFLDRETERLLYTNTVHLCILDLVISGLVYSRID
jgi:hypothetical protein